MKNITLVIPAKNEKESLPQVLNELKKFDYKIMVVLHKSDIETIESIKNYDVKIAFQNDFGYGDALITGIKETNTELFCIFNADGSFNPGELRSMYDKVDKDNFDLIFGSRYENSGGSEDDTLITLFGNYIFTYIGKYFFNLNITDILYTYVLGVTKKTTELNLERKDFSFCVELPIKAKMNKFKIGSIKSIERKRIAGSKKVNAFKDGFLILNYMIKLFFIKKS